MWPGSTPLSVAATPSLKIASSSEPKLAQAMPLTETETATLRFCASSTHGSSASCRRPPPYEPYDDAEPAVGEGAVVTDDDQLDLEAGGLGLLAREAEIQPIASVILHDHEAAAAASHMHDGCEHRGGGRAGEDGPGNSG